MKQGFYHSDPNVKMEPVVTYHGCTEGDVVFGEPHMEYKSEPGSDHIHCWHRMWSSYSTIGPRWSEVCCFCGQIREYTPPGHGPFCPRPEWTLTW